MARITKLTNENYYSAQANKWYMSASQYKAFDRCELAALAELRGEWKRPESTALSVGSYIDAYFSDELEQFKAANPDIYKRDGGLKAEYITAHNTAERLERDELARMLLAGKHQVIKTGQIGGVWFKAKFDSLLSSARVERICKKFPAVRDLVPLGGGMIVDLKYMRDFEPIWDDEAREKVGFINYWGYDIQGAIYQALDGNFAPFVIVAATKEAEPDFEAFNIPDGDLAYCLAEIETKAPRYRDIKLGKIAPIGCGKCAYCRREKKLNEIKIYQSITL